MTLTLRGSAPALAGAVTGGLLFLLADESLVDDAYITLSYARNLAFHGEWALVHGVPGNSATSPLNVWLTALGTLITRQSVVGAGVVLVASLAAVGLWSSQLARLLSLSRWLPYAVVALLATSPLLASTVGLESYLGVALLVGLVRYAVEGRWMLAGVLAGLLVLCRPDYGVIAVVVAVLLLPRRLLGVGAVAVVVALPWHVVSWWWLGSAVPDTLVFKATEDHPNWLGSSVADPLAYVDQFATDHVLLAVLPAALGVLCLAGWAAAALAGYRHPAGVVVAVFALAGVSHWAALAVLGVPPYLWYYAPLLAGLSLCAVITAAVPSRVALPAVGGVVITGLVAASLLLSGPVPWREAPLAGNFGAAAQYAAIGRDVGGIVPRGEPVGSSGEVGTVASHCGCRLVDQFSDRSVAAVKISKAQAGAGPVGRVLLDLNYRNMPVHAPPPEPSWRLEYRTDPAERRPSDVRWWPATMSWHAPAQIVLVRDPPRSG